MSSDSEEEEDTEYPYQEPRVDAVLYQAKIPPLSKTQRKKEFRSRGDVKKWDPTKLSDGVVDEYVQFARAVFGDPSAFNAEPALDLLHDCSYDITRAKYRLLRPSAASLGVADDDKTSLSEMRAVIDKFVADSAADKARDHADFLARLDAASASHRVWSFNELQALILESALRCYDCDATTELRLLQARASRLADRIRPLLVNVKERHADLAQLQAMNAEGANVCARVLVPECADLQQLISTVVSWSQKVIPTLAQPESLSLNAVSGLLNEASRLFPGVSCPETERLQKSYTFGRELIETISRRVFYSKKTRNMQSETKLKLDDAIQLMNQFKTEFAFLNIRDVYDLQDAIDECTDVCNRARAAMEKDEVADCDNILEELKGMLLELPEIDLILSFHQGRSWAAQVDQLLKGRPKLPELRRQLTEADSLALTAPPHLAKKQRMQQLLDDAMQWQDRAKETLAEGCEATKAQIDQLLADLQNIPANLPEEARLSSMVRNANELQQKIESRMADQSKRFTLEELVELVEETESDDVCKIESEIVDELIGIKEFTSSWTENVRALLEKEFPRILQLRGFEREAQTAEELQRVDLKYLPQLREWIEKIEAKLVEAVEMLKARVDMKSLTSLYTFLNKHGLTETDKTFSQLKERFTEASDWVDSARRFMPPKLVEGAPIPKRLPGVDRLASLVEQAQTSTELLMVELEDVPILAQHVEVAREWQARARKALDDEESLEVLSPLFAEGRRIPIRMAEKDAMESRIWAMGWVERAQKYLGEETSLEDLCKLFEELHAYKLDANIIKETEEIWQVESRIQEAFAWCSQARKLFAPHLHPLRLIAMFGSGELPDFVPLTSKPGLEFQFMVSNAKDQVMGEDGDESSSANAASASSSADDVDDANEGGIAGRRRPARVRRQPAAVSSAFVTSTSSSALAAVAAASASSAMASSTSSLKVAASKPARKTGRGRWGHRHAAAASSADDAEQSGMDVDKAEVEDCNKPDDSGETGVDEIGDLDEAGPLDGDAADDQLYCICRQPHVDGVLMLGCEQCDQWFHLQCLGLNKLESAKIEKFVCIECCAQAHLMYPFRDRYPPKKLGPRGPKLEEILSLVKSVPTKVKCPEMDGVRKMLKEIVEVAAKAHTALAESIDALSGIGGVAGVSQDSPLNSISPFSDTVRACLAVQQYLGLQLEVPPGYDAVMNTPFNISTPSSSSSSQVKIESISDSSSSLAITVKPEMVDLEMTSSESISVASAAAAVKLESEIVVAENQSDVADVMNMDAHLSSSSSAVDQGSSSTPVQCDPITTSTSTSASTFSPLSSKPADRSITSSPARVLNDASSTAPTSDIKTKRSKAKPSSLQPSSSASSSSSSTTSLPHYLTTPLAVMPPAWSTPEAEALLGALVESLQLAHIGSMAVPVELPERKYLEDRLRVLQVRHKIQRLLSQPSMLKDLRSTCLELRQSVVGPGSDLLVNAFEGYVTDAESWLSVVHAQLERRSTLSDLQVLAQQADTRYARVICPDRKALADRIAATKEFLAKLRAAIKKKARHSTMTRLLVERAQVCEFVTSPEIESTEREVYRAESWRERLYAAVERKAEREEFVALYRELNGSPSPIIADMTDISTLEDCMLLFCLCQKSWQNDVFMIGCDGCEDWFHPECVGLDSARARRIKNFICPRCHEMRNADPFPVPPHPFPWPYGECVQDLKPLVESHGDIILTRRRRAASPDSEGNGDFNDQELEAAAADEADDGRHYPLQLTAEERQLLQQRRQRREQQQQQRSIASRLAHQRIVSIIGHDDQPLAVPTGGHEFEAWTVALLSGGNNKSAISTQRLSVMENYANQMQLQAVSDSVSDNQSRESSAEPICVQETLVSTSASSPLAVQLPDTLPEIQSDSKSALNCSAAAEMSSDDIASADSAIAGQMQSSSEPPVNESSCSSSDEPSEPLPQQSSEHDADNNQIQESGSSESAASANEPPLASPVPPVSTEAQAQVHGQSVTATSTNSLRMLLFDPAFVQSAVFFMGSCASLIPESAMSSMENWLQTTGDDIKTVRIRLKVKRSYNFAQPGLADEAALTAQVERKKPGPIPGKAAMIAGKMGGPTMKSAKQKMVVANPSVLSGATASAFASTSSVSDPNVPGGMRTQIIKSFMYKPSINPSQARMAKPAHRVSIISQSQVPHLTSGMGSHMKPGMAVPYSSASQRPGIVKIQTDSNGVVTQTRLVSTKPEQQHRVRVIPQLVSMMSGSNANSSSVLSKQSDFKPASPTQSTPSTATSSSAPTAAATMAALTASLTALLEQQQLLQQQQQSSGDDTNGGSSAPVNSTALSMLSPLLVLNFLSVTEAAQNFTLRLFDATVGFMSTYESKVALFHFLSTFKHRPLTDSLREELWAGISRLVPDPLILQQVLTIGQQVYHNCVEEAVRQLLPTLQQALSSAGANPASATPLLANALGSLNQATNAANAHSNSNESDPASPSSSFSSPSTPPSSTDLSSSQNLSYSSSSSSSYTASSSSPTVGASVASAVASMSSSRPAESSKKRKSHSSSSTSAFSASIRQPTTFLHLFSHELAMNKEWMRSCLHHLQLARLSGSYQAPLGPLHVVGLAEEQAALSMMAQSNTPLMSQKTDEVESLPASSATAMVQRLNAIFSIDPIGAENPNADIVLDEQTKLPNHLFVEQWNSLSVEKQRYFFLLARHDQLRYEREIAAASTSSHQNDSISSSSSSSSASFAAAPKPRSRPQKQASSSSSHSIPPATPVATSLLSPTSLRVPFLASNFSDQILGCINSVRLTNPRRAQHLSNSTSAATSDSVASASKKRKTVISAVVPVGVPQNVPEQESVFTVIQNPDTTQPVNSAAASSSAQEFMDENCAPVTTGNNELDSLIESDISGATIASAAAQLDYEQVASSLLASEPALPSSVESESLQS